MARKCFATVRSRKCRRVVLFTDLVSTSLKGETMRQRGTTMCRLCYLIDAANPKAESPAFNTCTIHVIPDEQNKLFELGRWSGMWEGSKRATHI